MSVKCSCDAFESIVGSKELQERTAAYWFMPSLFENQEKEHYTVLLKVIDKVYKHAAVRNV